MQINIQRLKSHLDILYEEKRQMQQALRRLTQLCEYGAEDPAVDLAFLTRKKRVCQEQLNCIQRRIALLTQTLEDVGRAQRHIENSLDAAVRKMKNC